MKRLALLGLLAVLLAACPQTHPYVGNPIPELPPGSYANELEKVLALTNAARAHERNCGSAYFAATAPLSRNSKLDTAAQYHAEDMAAANQLTHSTPSGAIHYTPGMDVGQRVLHEGYNYRAVGENIAAGQTSAEQVVTGWLHSPDHCANIMNPNFEEIGLGYKKSADNTPYWVQDFGAR